MKRKARFLLLLVAVVMLVAPIATADPIKLILWRLDGCFPNVAKTSSAEPKYSFVTDTCSFTYQGSVLFVQGTSEAMAPWDETDAFAVPEPAGTKLTVILKRGSTTLLTCSKETNPYVGEGPAHCEGSKIFTGSIPLGATLTCTVQAKLTSYSQLANHIGATGSCLSLGSRLN